jgi:hypothetical protein
MSGLVHHNKKMTLMSVSGQKLPQRSQMVMSASPPKADTKAEARRGSFGPISDIKQLIYLKSGKTQFCYR